ncbi:fungal-specific transcription factor domain-containing protein [Chlamydoabsidia padenii]|nr:fungal-specific transcription factor domain-containing protein [Chlamydoabsidia padenii]
MDSTSSPTPHGRSMAWNPPTLAPSNGIIPVGTTQDRLLHSIPHNRPQYTASTTLTNSPQQCSKRSRITRACDTCRKKKIRCDVDNCQPCTTCKQYDWQCTFNDTARKRGPPKGYIEGLEARLARMEQLLSKTHGDDPDNGAPIHAVATPQTPLPHHSTVHHTVEPIMKTTTVTASSSLSYSCSAPLENKLLGDCYVPPKGKIVRYLGSSSMLYMVNDILEESGHSKDKVSFNCNSSTSIVAQNGNKIPRSSENVSSGNSLGTSSVSENDNDDNSANFTSLELQQGIFQMRRINGHNDDLVMVRDETEDERKAQAAAGFEQEKMESIIPRYILTNLINIYFDPGCPTLPILDKEEFISSFQGTTTPPLSPILIYAVCSYACFLIPSDHPLFTQSGFGRDYIFQTLVDRACNFIRSEHLVPQIQTIQALILLCAHPIYSSISYRNWILSGMAVRMAQDLGLHRSVVHTGTPAHIVENRRRLWYSVYLTERWCCSVMGRPLAIADSDCDVDLPSVDAVDQPGKYAMFVNLVKLSGILGEVLRRIYSPKAKAMGYATHIMEQTVWSLDKMLKEWWDDAPKECLITQDQLGKMKGMEHTHSDIFRSGGPLSVCYYAVVVLLFRPFIVIECRKHHSSKLFDDAPKRCMDAAKNAIDVARHIPGREVARFGWNFAGYAVFQATLIHIYNCTSDDPYVAQMSRDYVRTSIDECVAPLSNDIPFGPPAVQFAENLLRLVKMNTSSTSDNTTTSFDQQPLSAPIHDQPPASAKSTFNNAQTQSPSSPDTALHYRTTSAPLPQMIPTALTSDHRTRNDNCVSSIPTFGSSTRALVGNNITNNHGTIKSSLSTAIPKEQSDNGTFASNPMDFITMALNGDPLADDKSNSIMTQETWQYLFTSAGTPFATDANDTLDFQASWENMFMENPGGL